MAPISHMDAQVGGAGVQQAGCSACTVAGTLAVALPVVPALDVPSQRHLLSRAWICWRSCTTTSWSAACAWCWPTPHPSWRACGSARACAPPSARTGSLRGWAHGAGSCGSGLKLRFPGCNRCWVHQWSNSQTLTTAPLHAALQVHDAVVHCRHQMEKPQLAHGSDEMVSGVLLQGGSKVGVRGQAGGCCLGQSRLRVPRWHLPAVECT
jgi:hypothetical protein